MDDVIRRWSEEANDFETIPFTSLATGVALKEKFFGEGAERLVQKFCTVGPGGKFIGPAMVAKSSRFLEVDAAQIDYHREFCRTQALASKFGKLFNARLDAVSATRDQIVERRSTYGSHFRIPRVQFLECFVYVMTDVGIGRTGLLVEKMLDPKRYRKWNGNNGYVSGQNKKLAAQKLAELAEESQAKAVSFSIGDAIEEGDEEESSSDEEDTARRALQALQALQEQSRAEPTIKLDDIPQAFSHFTYFASKRKFMVCDLQGVLDESQNPPLFELTDPVIHYKSNHGRKNVFGRTDHGQKGMDKFFCTHECNALCRLLHLPDSKQRRPRGRRGRRPMA
eukprot:SAG25_NODE_1513_length_2865_cov_3.743312_1_plen_338_part_00